MLNFFARRLKELHEVERGERGFTLIELLIVVIIIGILAAIAIPTFLAQREKAQVATCQSDTRNAAEAAVLHASDQANGDFTGLPGAGDDAALAAQGFNQTEGYDTEVTGTAASVTITTTCPTPAGGTATWTTDDPAAGATGPNFRGEVRYNAP